MELSKKFWLCAGIGNCVPIPVDTLYRGGTPSQGEKVKGAEERERGTRFTLEGGSVSSEVHWRY